MNKELIKKLTEQEKIRITEHFIKRITQRNISIGDVIKVLKNCEIIEEYPQDYPYPSCLTLGFYKNNIPLHIVCGLCEDEIWLITAYNPNEKQWDDFRYRKG